MKNYEGNTPEEKLKMVPKEATLTVEIPGLEGPPEEIPIGLFCEEAVEALHHLSSVVSGANMQLDNCHKQIKGLQKDIHDLRGSIMTEANKVAQSISDVLKKKIKDLEAELETVKAQKTYKPK